MPSLILLPYYCDAEIKRYLKIAHLLETYPKMHEVKFLVAYEDGVGLSQALVNAYQALAPVESIACRLHERQYPERATEMFWQIMDHVKVHSESDGFALWLESDMVPIRSDWFVRLVQAWRASPGLWQMGAYFPRTVGKHATVPEHINGGACYAQDLALHIPPHVRTGSFDLSLFAYTKQYGTYLESTLFRLAALHEIDSYIQGGEACILHGYLQDKDAFVNQCVGLGLHQEGNLDVPQRNSEHCCVHAEVTRFGVRCPIHSTLGLGLSRSDL